MASTIVAPPSPVQAGRIEPNPRRVRGTIDQLTVVDSTEVALVWEHAYYPVWYVPVDDVAGTLRPAGDPQPTDRRGPAQPVDLVLDDGRVVADAGLVHLEAPDEVLRDRVRLRWEALDRWFEETEEVFIHPRSPYARVDALPSDARVVVRVDGTVVADSSRPVILYETGLPPRFYLPPADVRMDLLTPSPTSTGCPYKGQARYWDVTVDGTGHGDLAWGYDRPLPESAPVAGLICFYDEQDPVQLDVQITDHPDAPIGGPGQAKPSSQDANA
jgi:uncharacterized protein (DUF427 family)